MRCLVTYDVNKPHHDALKDLCIKAGFQDYVDMPDGSRRQLPNTTLIVIAVNAEDAVNKFKEQVKLVTLSGLMSPSSPPVKIEKVIGVEYTRCCAENDNSYRNALADLLPETPHRNALADALRRKG